MSDVAERLALKGPAGNAASGTQSREMRLSLSHLGVWSCTKLAFVLSLCLNLVTSALIYLASQLLTSTAVFQSINSIYNDLLNQTLDLGLFLNADTFFGFAVAVAVVNTVLFTALGAAYAVLYNFSVRVTGGGKVGFIHR